VVENQTVFTVGSYAKSVVKTFSTANLSPNCAPPGFDPAVKIDGKGPDSDNIICRSVFQVATHGTALQLSSYAYDPILGITYAPSTGAAHGYTSNPIRFGFIIFSSIFTKFNMSIIFISVNRSHGHISIATNVLLFFWIKSCLNLPKYLTNALKF